MRQIWITRPGPPSVLQVREADDPVAGPGEVRIRVKAAGVNFADLMARLGIYPDAPRIPCVIGYEVAGIVDQVGADVTDLTVGERVFGMPKFGGYSDTIVLPAAQARRMPAAMSFEEAAALPVVYLTAHHILFFTGHLRPGSKVLIHSAAGGVGLAAIQLAHTRDCTIFGTASKSKHEYLRSVGCQHPLDSAGDVTAQVRAIVGETGLDLVLDPVGGRSWREGYALLGPAGRLVCYGFSTAATGTRRNLLHAGVELLRIPRWSPLALMNDNKEVAGVNMAHLFGRLDLLQPQFDALAALYEQGKIAPTVDRTFPFDEAAAAHQYLHDRKAKGKVILVPWGSTMA